MSAASALVLPPISEPWYAKPFRFATLPKAAEKVWACIKFVSFQRKSPTISITDRFGSQWCSAHLGVHVGRRCFQKGLKQLQDLGAILRHRSHGGREITITVNLAGPKPKPKAQAAKAKATPKPTAQSIPVSATPAQAAEPPESPDELRQAAADLRAFIAQVHAQEMEQAARTTARAEEPPPSPTVSTCRPRLTIPEAIRREIEEKERRRRADELAGLRDIPDDRRTDDQERLIRRLAEDLGEPGTPPAPAEP